MNKINPCVAEIEFDQQSICNLCKKFVLALHIVFGSSVFVLSAQAQDRIAKIQRDTLFSKPESTIPTQIKGTIIDAETNEPISTAFVWIEIDNQEKSTTTNRNGNFVFNFESPLLKKDDSLTLNLIVYSSNYDKFVIENVIINKGKTTQLGKVYIKRSYDFIGAPDYHRSTTIKREEIERFQERP